MKKTVLLFVFIITGFYVFSQLNISAEIRPRAEFRRGYALLPQGDVDPAFFISQRTRLNSRFSGEKFRFGMSLQDTRVWGDASLSSATGVFGDDASIDMKEGWIELLPWKQHAFKIGRQYLSYQDERLLSYRNWNQHSITYDAVLYKFSRNDFDLHVNLSYNNHKENIFGTNYNIYQEVIRFDSLTQTVVSELIVQRPRIKTLNFLYLEKRTGRSEVSVISLATGLQNPETSNTIYVKGTYGGFYKYTGDRFNFRSTAYYQHGKNVIGSEVSAYMFHLMGDYKINRFDLSAGVDHLSGHDQLNDNENYQQKDHFFDIFYGNRHGYYGHMDYFSNMSVATRNGGLVDSYGGITFNLTTDVDLKATYHYFRLQSRVADPANVTMALDKTLGSELDLSFRIKILPEIRLDGGFSMMLPSESLEKIQKITPGESRFAYWGWLMLTVKPVLFKG
ncbi:MAG: alginate export family protein [Bacteroidales bacterium]